MKIKIVQDIIIGYGPQRLFKGDVVDLPETVATGLVANQDALPIDPMPIEKPKSKRKKKESE